MVISRKSNLLLFLIVIIIISFSPITLAGVSFIDIHANQIFFRGGGNGQIKLGNDGSASQIQIINGVVEFTNFSIGSGSISFVGFNASDNTNVTALIVSQSMVTYGIDANNGINTTTVIKAPSGTSYVDVDGADSFTFDQVTELVNIYEVHGLNTKQITVYFNLIAGINSSNILMLILLSIMALLIYSGVKRK